MLEVRGAQVRYGTRVAVDDLDLEVADGEVVTILGPSGCGKSTLLRAIAGLEPLTAGTIALDGRDLRDRRPDQRHVGLMFQDHALFPHRTAGDNVAFGPRMRRLPATEVRARVAEALALVDLAGAGDRPVTELSGGEQQRVALARALATRPRLLMLDEPLGSLDRGLRDQLLDQLPDVFARVGCGVLYVTHDQDEALSLADRVAVMRAGRLLQVDRPDRLWRAPASTFVARFLGLDQLLPATVHDGVATTAIGRFPADGAPDGTAAVVLLPDAVRLLDEDDEVAADELVLDGTVTRARFVGDHTSLAVRCGDLELRAPARGLARRPAGTAVRLAVDPTRTAVVPDV